MGLLRLAEARSGARVCDPQRVEFAFVFIRDFRTVKHGN